jgi:hypothetical protein
MDLLVNALKLAIAELAKAKGIKGARVLDKLNARGEVVIALILPQRGSALRQIE